MMDEDLKGCFYPLILTDKLTEFNGRTQLELFVKLMDVIASKKSSRTQLQQGAKFRDIYSRLPVELYIYICIYKHINVQ